MPSDEEYKELKKKINQVLIKLHDGIEDSLKNNTEKIEKIDQTQNQICNEIISIKKEKEGKIKVLENLKLYWALIASLIAVLSQFGII